MLISMKFSHARLHIFSTLTLTLIFFVVLFANSLIWKRSGTDLILFEAKTNVQRLQIHEALQSQGEWQSRDFGTLRMEESKRSHFEGHGSRMMPPLNVTKEERIAWWEGLGIFNSTKLSTQFDGRVRKFLGQNCKVQFFMTWISSVESFGRREFFTLESLFKAHPTGCLIILSSAMDSETGKMILNPLVDRGFRVLAVTPDLPFLLRNTPAEAWFNDLMKGTKDPGAIPLGQNLSNLMRLAVLYKYGGVYLDTDFIILKDISGLRNSVGAQSCDRFGNWTRLNNAVLIFDRGHPLVYKFIEEFASNFDGNRWGKNGPYLVSRVVEKVLETTKDLNFTILPPLAFYPVDWIRIQGFFAKPNDEVHSKWIEAKLQQLGQESYGVHLWNRESRTLEIEEGSIIGRLLSGHCSSCKTQT